MPYLEMREKTCRQVLVLRSLGINLKDPAPSMVVAVGATIESSKATPANLRDSRRISALDAHPTLVISFIHRLDGITAVGGCEHPNYPVY